MEKANSSLIESFRNAGRFIETNTLPCFIACVIVFYVLLYAASFEIFGGNSFIELSFGALHIAGIFWSLPFFITSEKTLVLVDPEPLFTASPAAWAILVLNYFVASIALALFAILIDQQLEKRRVK